MTSIRSGRRVGRAAPLFPWLISSLLTANPQSRIEHVLEEMPPISFPEIKARALASIEGTSNNYCNDDERESVLEPLLREVRAAQTVAEIFETLGLDNFMA
jgi:hypothetical protein